MGALRACAKATALALLVIAIVPVQGMLRPFDALAWRSARLWHRMVCRVLGISVELVGSPVQGEQAAYVGNHLSHLDIPLLGSVLRGSFVAKQEMRQWPLFGTLASLQRSAFVSRAPGDARVAADSVAAILTRGRNLIVFPEGTSSDGREVLPFKTSLFAVLLPRMAHGLRIQPFTIELIAVDGRRVDRASRDTYAYHREMVLAPHLWAFLHARGARLRLHFHPPLPVMQGEDRKQLARRAHAAVSSMADTDP